MLVASEILASTQDEKSKPIAQNLYDGAVALNKRIDELMDISRGEIGTLQVKLEKCDVISVIRNTVDELLCLFQNREQTLTLTADTSGLMINIDPERIRQILVNLLDNASKFTPRGGRVSIRMQLKTSFLLVEVEDNGLGVPDAEKAKIFEPYYSLRDSRQSRPGIGLGLALAKMFVKLHGGEINVRDAQFQGSIFYFSLPIKDNI
jgi:signal transduction histidine kinase